MIVNAGRCAVLFAASLIFFVKCVVFRMVGCQDATDDGDQGDAENSELKNGPVERPGATKVVNAQILAGGYTKGLLLHNHF